MADSDEETDNGEECVNLTGFLFGNIDEAGQLESDVFDLDTQRQLSSLGKLGFQTMLKEIVGQEKIYDDSDSDGD
ncbi:TATA box-binding protein binding [Popillia japonica]